MLKALFIILVLLIILRWITKPRIVINMGGMADNIRDQEKRKWQQYYKSKPEGTLNVDHIPEKSAPKKKREGGGEYIDYEEVK